MTFELLVVMQSQCPNLWHDLLNAGKLVNGQIVVPNDVGERLLQRCADPPPVVATAPGIIFEAKRRTEEEKTPLRAVCAVCEFNHDGICEGSSCCGGRVPVEVRLNLSTTVCPNGRW